MFERFRWRLTSGERYSTGRLTPQKRGIHCACQHFVSERVGVLAGVRRSSSQIAIRIALTHSTSLPFPAQFACALFVLDIAGDGAKSVPDGQKPSQSCCKEDAQKASRPCLRRCWRSCMDGASRGLAFGAGRLAQNQASLDWASSVGPS